MKKGRQRMAGDPREEGRKGKGKLGGVVVGG